jgi:hypothetical protein
VLARQVQGFASSGFALEDEVHTILAEVSLVGQEAGLGRVKWGTLQEQLLRSGGFTGLQAGSNHVPLDACAALSHCG